MMTLLNRYALSSCVVAGMLAGCGGSQPPIGAPGAMPQSPAIAQHPGHSRSWMDADVASTDLLYVADFDRVTVYSYPEGKLKGTLTGFDSAVGDCVDRSGNIFITNQIPNVIYEYAHGGTKRIAKLRTDVTPVGCSIDATSGNLAVTGFSHGADIFRGAAGEPTFYKDSHFYFMQFCAYDSNGDLFVKGWKNGKRGDGLVELFKGSSKFTDITLDATPDADGGIQWTGTRLAVGGYLPDTINGTPVIYRFRISGQNGRRTGTTKLGPRGLEPFQFLIDGSSAVVPNWYIKSSLERYDVLIYKYPDGGSPISEITRGVVSPRGVVVSYARRR